MPDALVAAIELAVGLASIAGAVALWRSGHLRWVSALLGLAGIAACANAIVALAGEV